MRHFVLVAIAALVIALVLVLVLGEEEAGEDTTTVTLTEPEAERRPPETTPTPPAGDDGSADASQVQSAVASYVEAAETGEVREPGLPTTDELSIMDVDVDGERATVRLAGGERLSLRKQRGRWRVIDVSVR